jgi:8-oxo-(d)GTP phosphatase
MPLFLVRHAQAGSRQEFQGPDDTIRPLTGRGRHQAADIAGIVKDMAAGLPTTVLTSPYRRCIETIAPFSAAIAQPYVIDERLAEGPTEPACVFVREVAPLLQTQAIVLCSHGDILPKILETLHYEDDLDLGSEPRVQKASIWMLDTDADFRFDRAVYFKPPC